jgi:hypothetical protein
VNIGTRLSRSDSSDELNGSFDAAIGLFWSIGDACLACNIAGIS